MEKKLEEFVKHIPVGHENAARIYRISFEAGLSNSATRHLIAEVNKTGELAIVNLQDGSGYFIPENDEELESYIRIEISRSRELEEKIRALKMLRLSNDYDQAYKRLQRALDKGAE